MYCGLNGVAVMSINWVEINERTSEFLTHIHSFPLTYQFMWYFLQIKYSLELYPLVQLKYWSLKITVAVAFYGTTRSVCISFYITATNCMLIIFSIFLSGRRKDGGTEKSRWTKTIFCSHKGSRYVMSQKEVWWCYFPGGFEGSHRWIYPCFYGWTQELL